MQFHLRIFDFPPIDKMIFPFSLNGFSLVGPM